MRNVPLIRAKKLFVAVALLLVHLSPAQAAENSTMMGDVLEDTKLYFTAPLRWDSRDWTLFAGTLGAIAVTHHYDDTVRQHFVANSTEPLDGSDPHSSKDWYPAAGILAGTWVYATLIQNRAGYQEGWSMIEAAGLSAASGFIFKQIAGRERPNETTDVNRWFSKGDSFPSSHTTVTFAIGTMFAESGGDDYRWIRRIVGYGAAGATAYLRMKHNEHWLSDNVAGAALGFTTANFVLKRRGSHSPMSALSVAPLDGGVLLTYSAPLR